MTGLKMNRIFLIIAALILVSVRVSFAQTDTVFASYTYTMGDNDTKSDARQLCFLYAKRQCLEKAGTFVQSELKVRKQEQLGSSGDSYKELTQQDISTYTAAFVKVATVSEEMNYSGGTISITMSVEAVVDMQTLFDQIIAVQNNDQLVKRVRDQQDQITKIESNIKELQNQLGAESPKDAQQARIERKDAFNKLNELEQINFTIASKTRLAAENIELGMTPDEVVSLIGYPRTTTNAMGYIGYNYGRVWVVFEHGIVNCVVKSDHYSYVSGRDYYETCYPRDLLK